MDRVGNSAEMNKDLIQQFVEEKLKKHQTMAAASQGIYYISQRKFFSELIYQFLSLEIVTFIFSIAFNPIYFRWVE